jgi:hypothetical protein
VLFASGQGLRGVYVGVAGAYVEELVDVDDGLWKAMLVF